jgi:ABC-2 type transport system ATP-binding protein
MIETMGLGKQFGDLVAVSNVTLNVPPGDVLALLGPNGAGKTTTVRMLSAILAPSQGWARLAGYDIVQAGDEVRRRVGVLTEAPGLYLRMTGWEYLDFFGQLWGMPSAFRKSRIDALAQQFRVGTFLSRRIGEYSKGMRQKVALLRTLLHNPPVLLLDEPTSAMDPESARLVRDIILEMRQTGNHSIIVCTHNLPEAEELADRIAIIDAGCILAQGTALELKRAWLGPPLMELRFGAGGNGTKTPDIHNGVRQLVERFTSIESASELNGDPLSGPPWIRYAAAEPETVNPALLKELSRAGYPVLTLSEVAQSLENVYLRVMGRSEAVRQGLGGLPDNGHAN